MAGRGVAQFVVDATTHRVAVVAKRQPLWSRLTLVAGARRRECPRPALHAELVRRDAVVGVVPRCLLTRPHRPSGRSPRPSGLHSSARPRSWCWELGRRVERVAAHIDSDDALRAVGLCLAVALNGRHRAIGMAQGLDGHTAAPIGMAL